MSPNQNTGLESIEFADFGAEPKRHFDEVYLAVTTLFQHQKGAFAQHERDLAADILKRLSKDVEMSIRIRLAERLADDPAAPHELIVLLADDKIEIARPILARSPILCDADLVRVVEAGSPDHRIAVAERPGIGVTVSAALARSQCELAVIALMRNASAKIAADTFDSLAECARQHPRLQELLIERHDPPPELAQRLYFWVSGALKTGLAGRYPDLTHTIGSAIGAAATSLQSSDAPITGVNAKKLVEKLHASGQLRASFLIRVLNQGQMDLFEHGFAALLSMDVEIMRKALYGETPMRVALACRAAGIDRSVFMTVFNLSRHHRRVTAQVSESDQKHIGAIFSQVKKTEALDRLRSEAA